MKRTYLSFMTDALSVAIISFFISLALSRFYLGKGGYSIAVSILISLVLFLTYFRFSGRKLKKTNLKRKEEELFEAICDRLLFLPPKEAEKLVLERLPKSDGEIKCLFLPDSISANDLINLIRQKEGNLTVVGISFSDSAILFAEKADGVKLTPLKEIFDKISDIPVENLKSKKKTSFFKLFKNTFNRKRARIFALYGGSLLLMSNFVFYPLWYIISGCLFLFYALTATFFGV